MIVYNGGVRNAAERAYDEIRSLIAGPQFAAGDRLREEELSNLLGVSRTPVREALRRLAAEGMVEFLPHRGAHVTSWTQSQVHEIFRLRVLLEGHAAASAAVRIDGDGLAELRTLAVEMADHAELSPPNLESIAELNTRFHELLATNAGSDYLIGFLRNVVQIALVHRAFRQYSSRALARSVQHHIELVEAVEARDPEWAEAVMRSHILAAQHVLEDSDG